MFVNYIIMLGHAPQSRFHFVIQILQNYESGFFAWIHWFQDSLRDISHDKITHITAFSQSFAVPNSWPGCQIFESRSHPTLCSSSGGGHRSAVDIESNVFFDRVFVIGTSHLLPKKSLLFLYNSVMLMRWTNNCIQLNLHVVFRTCCCVAQVAILELLLTVLAHASTKASMLARNLYY